MTENLIVKQLQEIASKLTADHGVQKDLMQEMFVHLVNVQTTQPGQTLSWYLKSCEFYGRHQLDPACGIDLPMPLRGNGEHAIGGARTSSKPIGQIEIQGEVITNEVLTLILPHLSDKQQQVLFLLMKGCGVREAGRELGITHPAVIKHRKKIARIARELLQESEGVGVAIAVHNGTEGTDSNNGHNSGNGNGSANGNGDMHSS
jgi:hypothetical protein